MSQFIKRVLPKADADAYGAAKFIIQAHNASAKRWWGALMDIVANEWFLCEFPTMREWCQKYTTWAPGTIQIAIKEAKRELNKKLIADTTNEPIIREPKTSSSNNNGGEVTLPTRNTSCENNKKSESEVQCDEEGHKIPKILLEDYNTRDEFLRIMDELEAVKKKVVALRRTSRIWGKINGIFESHMEQAIHDVKNGVPHSVCTECQGYLDTTRNGTCQSCNSTGIMAKWQFNGVDETVKSQHRWKETDK